MLFEKALNPKKIVVAAAVLLCIASIYALYSFGVFQERLMRLAASSVFLILLLVFRAYRGNIVLLAFLCFWLSDIFIIQYEEALFNKLALAFPILAYIIVSVHVYLKIKPIRLSKYIKAVFVLVIVLNIYMIYKIVEIIGFDSVEITERVMICANGLALIVMGTMAGVYNLNYNSVHSVYCIFFVFIFVLSAICNVLAYYLDIELLFYFNRCLYVLGLTVMLLYLLLKKSEEILLE